MISFARIVGVVVLSAITAAQQQTIPGTFALVGKAARTTAQMAVTWRNPHAVDIAIQEKLGRKLVRDYEIDMLYHMHLIVVRSDFQQFLHVHPKYDSGNGTFTSTLPLDRAHSYYVYADTWPTNVGEQVFRFALTASAPRAVPLPITTAASGLTQPAGPYNVRLGATTLRAKTSQDLAIDISMHGKPATDIHPYLGAPAHAIFINAETLAFTHIHPVTGGNEMNMANVATASVGLSGPHQVLRVPALAAGTYKLWFQFRGGKKLYVAAYTIVVR